MRIVMWARKSKQLKAGGTALGWPGKQCWQQSGLLLGQAGFDFLKMFEVIVFLNKEVILIADF